MNEKEIWKDLPGFEGIYQVSNLGRVKSLSREVFYKNGVIHPIKEKILTPCIVGKGYLQIHLRKDGKSFKKYLHRLVAMTFIPNPDNLPEVNHISEDKTDCSVTNLEWISHLDNIRHGTGIQRGRDARIANGIYLRNMKKIKCIELNKIFNSISDASRELGCAVCTIVNHLCDRTKTAAGYHWQYVS